MDYLTGLTNACVYTNKSVESQNYFAYLFLWKYTKLQYQISISIIGNMPTKPCTKTKQEKSCNSTSGIQKFSCYSCRHTSISNISFSKSKLNIIW